MMALADKTLHLPATITLTRVGRRRMDGDNLQGSLKACRDGVAKSFGVDDSSGQYTWEYRQEIGKQYGVRIEIR